MNDEERNRILRMVAEGQISPEEAGDLLEALETSSPPEAEGGRNPVNPIRGLDEVAKPRRRTRKVVIQIREGGENKVNLAIPMSLTRTAGKFMPRQAQQYLGKYDINLQELLEDMADGDSGAVLEIKEGENKVLIAVE